MSDLLNRYIFTEEHVRGELVQLEKSFQEIVGSQNYPSQVSNLLGEMLSAASLLSATLKFEGEISLQVQSQGIIQYAVVDVTHEQKMRGIARWDQGAEIWPESFNELFARGMLAITITPLKGERYQGIVSLDKGSLAACLEEYFNQSEQLATHVRLYTDGVNHAGGTLLQVLPQSSAATDKSTHNAFNDLAVLTESLTSEELFSLDAKTILHRLYHEFEIELFPSSSVEFKCTCSKQRSGEALKNIDKAELLQIIEEEGQIKMNCQYCNAEYVFDQMDVESIHAGFGDNATRAGDKPLA
jgi:molecular chaperone Hsp33